jgi:hypothetical protein
LSTKTGSRLHSTKIIVVALSKKIIVVAKKPHTQGVMVFMDDLKRCHCNGTTRVALSKC